MVAYVLQGNIDIYVYVYNMYLRKVSCQEGQCCAPLKTFSYLLPMSITLMSLYNAQFAFANSQIIVCGYGIEKLSHKCTRTTQCEALQLVSVVLPCDNSH